MLPFWASLGSALFRGPSDGRRLPWHRATEVEDVQRTRRFNDHPPVRREPSHGWGTCPPPSARHRGVPCGWLPRGLWVSGAGRGAGGELETPEDGRPLLVGVPKSLGLAAWRGGRGDRTRLEHGRVEVWGRQGSVRAAGSVRMSRG